MKQLPLPMSALEIMQACFKEYEEESENARHYLEGIEKVINGEVILLTSQDFFEIHKYVITIFSGILNDKGKVAQGKWTDKHWDNVLKQIEKCYSKDDTYEVSKMIKK